MAAQMPARIEDIAITDLQEVESAIRALKRNKYEETHDIKTLTVFRKWEICDTLYIYTAKKSDNSETLFIVFKQSRWAKKWRLMCPDENQLLNFHKITNRYKYTNKYNNLKRGYNDEN